MDFCNSALFSASVSGSDEDSLHPKALCLLLNKYKSGGIIEDDNEESLKLIKEITSQFHSRFYALT